MMGASSACLDLLSGQMRAIICSTLMRNCARASGASGPQLASTRSRKANFAAIWMSWFLCASYEPLAEATSNPRTRAVIVANQAHGKFHRVFGISAQVILGQNRAHEHA